MDWNEQKHSQKLSHFAFVSLLNHLWWNTKSHSRFLWVKTLKTFPFSSAFAIFLTPWKKKLCAVKNNGKAFWFSVFQRTIYRNLFLLPFTFHPLTLCFLLQKQASTKPKLSTRSTPPWRKQPPLLFYVKTFHFSPLYIIQLPHLIMPPTLLFRLCWFLSLSLTQSFLSLLRFSFEKHSHPSHPDRRRQLCSVMMCTFN